MKPWPRLPSDPRLYYFAVPNEIFRNGITACEFSILAYLFSRQMKKLPPTNLMTVKMNLSVSRNTIKKYVRILENRGLVSLQRDKRFLRGSVSLRDTIMLTEQLKLRVGHLFPLPNSVFSFGLSVGEVAVYGYLLYREDRESYECWPSYRTIGAALCMSRNTVMKYVHRLEEKDFIMTEPTQVKRSDGFKWNGNLKYRVRPIQSVIKRYNDAQMKKARLEQERFRLESLAKKFPGLKVTIHGPEATDSPDFHGF